MQERWFFSVGVALALCACGPAPAPRMTSVPAPTPTSAAPAPLAAASPDAARDEPATSTGLGDAPASTAAPVTPAPATAPAAAPTTAGIGPAPAISEETAKALRFEIHRNRLWVTDGKRRAPVGVRGATHIEGFKRWRDANGGWQLSVEYLDGATCRMDVHKETFPAGHLVARLDNAAALTRHRRKDFRTAAAGFARAAARHPGLDVAWSNLASAYALLGERDRAAAALVPLIERDPVRTYHKVHADPELASLRDAPALVALHAPRPGTASLVVQRRAVTGFKVAFSPATRTLAVVREEGNEGCGVTVELLFFDASTGRERSRVVLVDWLETAHDCKDDGYLERQAIPRVKTRLQAVDRTLANLGFSVAPGLERVEMEGKHRSEKVKAYFRKARLGLVTLDGTARVVRGDRVLGEAHRIPYTTPSYAIHEPQAQAMVFGWLGSFPEGCNAEFDQSGITVIPLGS